MKPPNVHRRPPRRRRSSKRRDRVAVPLGDKLGLRPGVAREPDGMVRARSTARVLFVGAAIVLGYTALLAKASALMMLPDDRLEAQAAGQFEQAVVERGRRGDILDRNGRILATTVDLHAVHVDPSLLSEDGQRRLARVAAPVLDLDAQQLESRLTRPGRRDLRLARGLTPEEVTRFRSAIEDDRELRGAVFVRRDRRRFYPGREDGASLLGVVGQTGVGLAGLERVLDDELGGDTVKYVQWRDRKGRRITVDRPEAEPGDDVILTIDRRIQRVTEEALATARESTGAEGAHAVVVDVKSGEILAMATVPGLNPNDQARIDIGLLKNRAVMDAIEPGSVFKPFVAAAALEEGVMTTTSTMDCERGAWTLGRKTIRDEHPIDVGTLAEIIKYSSNICAAKLALELGPERTLGYLSAFGFGRSTGLDLPGETRGLLRSPKDIRRIELATTAYGYGASATALHLASGIATLANGGVRMEPRLVREVRDRHGDLVARHPPREAERVVSEQTARQVVEMMVAVTEKGGTGTKAAVPGYRVAGKTGTAKKLVDGQYSATERVGSWVGIIPADDPVLAIAVMVDGPTIGPRFGGWTAAPAFKQIASDSLRILGVDPDPELLALATAKPPKSPAALRREQEAAAKAEAAALAELATAQPALSWTGDHKLRAPDLSGLSLRDALVTLQGAGLAVHVEGSGRVSSQSPPPGTPLSPGASLQVLLR